MRTLATVLPLAMVLAAFSAAETASGLDGKCGVPAGVPVEEPLVALDGVITAVAVDEVPRDEVFSVEIVCMDPADSTFNRKRGIPVISVWTQEGPAPQMKPLLAYIHAFQTAHHERHGAYAEDLAGLDRSGFPRVIEVTHRASGDGWIAVAAIERFLSRCVVLGGEWPRPNPAVEPGQPECLTRDQFSRAVWPDGRH